MSESGKRQIYIVGGKAKNVPPWISAAFDWEQFEQDRSKTRTLEPSTTPDAVVVLSSWLGHEHFYGARTLAEKLGVPMIMSPGGWSGALKAAADLEVEWFLNDIDRARNNGQLDAEDVDAAEIFIDNAWREAYNREFNAREALEKRLTMVNRRLDHAESELSRLGKKDEAAQRVIAEVRKAAAAQRAALEEARSDAEERTKEIQTRSERVASALAAHIESLKTLFEATEDSHSSVLRASAKLADVRQLASRNLDVLRASLTIAEDGLPTITEDMQEQDANSVSASNADLDS